MRPGWLDEMSDRQRIGPDRSTNGDRRAPRDEPGDELRSAARTAVRYLDALMDAWEEGDGDAVVRALNFGRAVRDGLDDALDSHDEETDDA